MLELTQEYIQSLFTYRNGNLYWKVNKDSRAHNEYAIKYHGKYAKLNIIGNE